MRYIIAALLIAGAAWGLEEKYRVMCPAEDAYVRPGCYVINGFGPANTTAIVCEVEPPGYEIEIYGTAKGFCVTYRWLVPGEGSEVTFWVEGEKDCEWALTGPFAPYHYETAKFYVDSLTDIRPTPAEMEER